MTKPSGSAWCALFPTSTSIDELQPEFAAGVTAFLHEVKCAGASVHISATTRPKERAFLMHWAWKLSNGAVRPSDIPKMEGVDIDWTRGGNLEDAVHAAHAMVATYRIAYEPSLTSDHIEGRAIDMTIHWKGVIHVKDARGIVHPCEKQEDLWPIGASFKVFKLAKDAPHWSDDGL